MLLSFLLSLAVSPGFGQGGSVPPVVAVVAEDKSTKPTDEESASLRSAVRALYEDEFAQAKDKDARNALARQLLELARQPDASEEPGQRYGLLMEAYDLAVRSRDLELAFGVIDSLVSWYRPLDRRVMRIRAVLMMGERGSTPRDLRYFARECFALIDDCLQRESADDADGLLKAIGWTIKKLGDEALTARRKEANQHLKELESYLAALEVLKESADDPKANKTVGWYTTFFHGDFDGGLPLLALAPKATVTDCVQRDLAQPTDPVERLTTARTWQAWGAKRKDDRVKHRALQRAAYWAELALPGLTGKKQARCEKLLSAVREYVGDAVASVAPSSPAGSATARSRHGITVTQRKAIDRALDWLIEHQSADGSWRADSFGNHCACGGRGKSEYSVGVTGLALIALLEAHGLAGDAPGAEAIVRGLKWLQAQQDLDTGLIGSRDAHDKLYGHGIAVVALANGHAQQPDASLKLACEAGVLYIHKARNPYGAWRYDVPAIGDNDSSVTSWMISALIAARQVGVDVDPANLKGALAWFDEVTDPATGHCGYEALGTPSARTPDNIDRFPKEGDESMTAASLHSRVLLGQGTTTQPLMQKGSDRLLRSLPLWKKGGLTHNVLYWYYGTEALFAMREQLPKAWRSWRPAVSKALLDSQAKKGHAAGSWNPDGPWGYAGGRVYSTSLAILCLTKPKS